MAAAAALIFRALRKRGHIDIGIILGAAVEEIIMVGGYFFYESMVLAVGAAAVASIPFNLVQGSIGAVVGVTAAVLLNRGGMLDRQQ